MQLQSRFGTYVVIEYGCQILHYYFYHIEYAECIQYDKMLGPEPEHHSTGCLLVYEVALAVV